MASLVLGILLLSSCSSAIFEKKSLREEGLIALDRRSYQEAIAHFDAALALSDEYGRLELGVLKYRGEAEYLLEDYNAAAHTYRLLNEESTEEPDPYFLSLQIISSIKADADLDVVEPVFLKLTALPQKGELYGETLDALAGEWIYLYEATKEESWLEKAEQYYQSYLEDIGQSGGSDRDFLLVYKGLGTVAYHRGLYEEALLAFKEADSMLAAMEEKEQEQVKEIAKAILFNTASTYGKQSEYEKSLTAFEEYIARYGEDDRVRHAIRFLKLIGY